MKLLLFFIALLGLTQSFNFNHNPGKIYSTENKCKTILDSAYILIQTGDFSINWEAKQIDKERQLEVSKWFEKRSFSDFVCLLESDNKLYKFYGYVYAAMNYQDSLKNTYSYLLNDTTSMQYNTENGLVDTKTTLGGMLKLMSDKIAEDHANMNKRPDIETKVSLFIKEYALYPDTYKSISFPYFSMGSDETGLTDFTITHEYQIKNTQGKSIRVTSAFVLDPKLNINVIEQDSTSYISSYPPKLGDWLKNYGRPLNHDDSVNLKLRAD
jgi:hypothetical protein